MRDANETAERRAQISELIQRYPALDDAEREDVIRFLTKGPFLDVGLIKGEAALQPAIARIEADHAQRFGAGIGRGIMLAVLWTIPILLLGWLAWDAGVK